MYLSYRADYAFKDSLYGHSPKKMKIWRIFLCSSSLLIWILTFTHMETTPNYQLYGDISCRANHPPLTALVIVTTDTIACFINLYLFVKPLLSFARMIKDTKQQFGDRISSGHVHIHTDDKRTIEATQTHSPTNDIAIGDCNSGGECDRNRMHSHTIVNCESPNSNRIANSKYAMVTSQSNTNIHTPNNNGNNNNIVDETKFVTLAQKNVILTSYGVISTIICGLSVGVSGLGIVFIGSDCIVNMLVIMLMFGWNENTYNKMCCICKQLCNKCCMANITHA